MLARLAAEAELMIEEWAQSSGRVPVPVHGHDRHVCLLLLLLLLLHVDIAPEAETLTGPPVERPVTRPLLNHADELRLDAP